MGNLDALGVVEHAMNHANSVVSQSSALEVGIIHEAHSTASVRPFTCRAEQGPYAAADPPAKESWMTLNVSDSVDDIGYVKVDIDNNNIRKKH